MLHRSLMCALAALLLTITGVAAFDDAMYPNWKGQWTRIGGFNWDPTKPRGGQQAPLTAEYQAVLDASMADQARGGQGNYPGYKCVPYGMPGMMLPYLAMEFVITPHITYIMLEHMTQHRRIYTDGRAWPKTFTPTFNGYSIGRWVDEDRDGRYDTLLIETRGMRGPRSFDSSGLPLHSDNETIVKERIYLDKADRTIMIIEITTIDNALTQPWSATKKYRRSQNPQPSWSESVCAESNAHVEIQGKGFMLSADGYLMPARKDQEPPDFRYFDQAKK